MKTILTSFVLFWLASAAMAQDPGPEAVWDGSACLERSAGQADRLAFFDVLMGTKGYADFTVHLRQRDPALRAVYPTPQEFQCELALAMKGALSGSGKELTESNGKYLTGALVVGSIPNDATHEFFDGLKALPGSAARVIYWEIPLLGMIGKINDQLTNTVRVAPGFEGFAITSGGVSHDAAAILAATGDYYEHWRRRDLPTLGYMHPAFMTFRDDGGAAYVAMIGVDKLFRVAPLDRRRSLQAYDEAYARLKVDGAGLDAGERATVEAAEADPGFALMVEATERSWEFEPLGVRNFLQLDGNFERLRDFGVFAGEMAARLRP